jgi:DNA-binding NtrC family response regulator
MAVIIFTAYATIETALRAVREGAFDYIAKPFSKEQLELAVERSFEHKRLLQENKRLRREVQSNYDFSHIIGKNPLMTEVLELITKIAPTEANVLICGESGTGKELIAHAVHFNSPRSKAAFVPIDCAALPETLVESELFGYERGAFTGAIVGKRGLLETADAGTLFLDEIGDLTLNIQAKLLRVLQERQFRRLGGGDLLEVDVRLIAATNRNLEELVAGGRFREDLFYRLNVVRISLPPLRERGSDIPLLANHFLQDLCNRWGKSVNGISSAAMMVLQNYHWPGNVRELRNAIEHALSLAESNQVMPADLPTHILAAVESPTGLFSQASFHQARQAAVRTFERQYLEQALRAADGRISQAAARAGIPRTTFHRLLRKHGLRGRDFLPRSRPPS